MAPIEHAQYGVWACVAIALILHSLLLFMISRMMPLKGSAPMSIGDAGLIVFNLFTLGKMEIDRHTFSARVLSVFIWFYSLFFFASLASVFPNQVFSKSYSHRFPSIADLTQNVTSQRNTYQWLFEENMTTLALVRQFNESWAAIFDEYLSPTTVNDSAVILPFSAIPAELQKNKQNIFITDETTAIYTTKTNCILIRRDSYLFPFDFAFLFRKNWKLKSQIDEGLALLETRQITRLLWLKWMTYKDCPNNVTIDIYAIMPYFAVLGAGVGLALLIALCEVMNKAIRTARARRSYTKFVFGRDFNCVVKATTAAGVWVEFHGRPVPYFIPNSHLHSHPIKKFTAKSLNISPQTVLTMRYFGKDPVTKKKKFFHNRSPETMT